MNLRDHVREIPDFPKPGIGFKDITPLLAHPEALRASVRGIAEPYRGRIDCVVGIESRGFILGTGVAYELGVGLVPVRKPGKLPAAVHEVTYELEYGSDRLEIHRDGFPEGSRVLVVDDLLATGGTAAAAVELVGRLGGRLVACAFVIELSFLGGRKALESHEVLSLIDYES